MKKMKKILALILCLVTLLAFTACDDGEKDSDIKDSTKENTKSTSKKASVSYYVMYKSTKIELGADATGLVEKLGTPKGKESGVSCGNQGELTVYTYDSIILYILKDGNKETVDQITFLDDQVETPEKISIGTKASDVTKACGNSYSVKKDSYVRYTSGSKNVQFNFKDGKVIKIDYINKTN